MASITVDSGTLNLSGTGTIAAVGPSPTNGPAHIVLATASPSHKRITAEFCALSIVDCSGFAVNDAVSITNNGDGTTTLSN